MRKNECQERRDICKITFNFKLLKPPYIKRYSPLYLRITNDILLKKGASFHRLIVVTAQKRYNKVVSTLLGQLLLAKK